jgi:hypothetical protein
MAKLTNSPHPRSRRSFLFGLAVAAAVPELPTVVGASIASMASLPAAGEQTQTHSVEVDILTEMVRTRYGKYLQSADWSIVQRGLDRLPRTAAEVLKVNIHNGDAPDCVFQADGL